MGTAEQIRSVRDWITAAKRVVALTGAGISTDSGIPDFRGPNGVWTRNPEAEKLSDIRYYMSDPEISRKSWQSRLAHPAFSAKPNPGHRALADLEKRGKLHALITQNIDGLHLQAGNTRERVFEVHGNLHQSICMSCGHKGPSAEYLFRTVEACERLGIRDRHLWAMQARVAERLAACDEPAVQNSPTPIPGSRRGG